MNLAEAPQTLIEETRKFINAELDHLNLKCLYLDKSTPRP